MHRLFVALRPPVAIRERLAMLMTGVEGARWQDDAQLHLTLRFIGEVERPVAEDIAHALSSVRADVPEVGLAGVGRFEKAGRANALWAGVAPADELGALHRKVDRCLVRCGLEPERRAFVPHVTLARFARTAGAGVDIDRWIAAHGGLTSVPFALPHLILYESRLGREGASYEPVMRWPLAG